MNQASFMWGSPPKGATSFLTLDDNDTDGSTSPDTSDSADWPTHRPASESIDPQSHGFSFPSVMGASEESATATHVHATLRNSASLPGIYLERGRSSPMSNSSEPSESVPSGSSFPASLLPPTSFTAPTSRSSSYCDLFQNVHAAMPRSNSGSSGGTPGTLGYLQPFPRWPSPSSSRLSSNTSKHIIGLPAPPRSRVSSQIQLSSPVSSNPTSESQNSDRRSDRRGTLKTRSVLLFSDVLAATSSPIAAKAETTSPNLSSFTRTCDTCNTDLATPSNIILHRSVSPSAPMTLSNSDDTIIVREPRPPRMNRPRSKFPTAHTEVQRGQQQGDTDEAGHRSYTTPTYRESSFVQKQHGSDAASGNANASGSSNLLLSRSRSDSHAPSGDSVGRGRGVATIASSSMTGTTTSYPPNQQVGAGMGRPNQTQKLKQSLHPIFPPGTLADDWEKEHPWPVLSSGAAVHLNPDPSPSPRQRAQSSGAGLGTESWPSTSPTINSKWGKPTFLPPLHFSSSGRRQQQQPVGINHEVPFLRARSPAEEGNEEDDAAARTLSKFERLRSTSSSPHSLLSPVRTQPSSQIPPKPKRSSARGATFPVLASAAAPVPQPAHATMSARGSAGSAADRPSVSMTPAPFLPPPSEPLPPPPPLTTSNSSCSIPTLSSHLIHMSRAASSPTTSAVSLNKEVVASARAANDSSASFHPFAATPSSSVDALQNAVAPSSSFGRTRKAPPVPASVSAAGGGSVLVGVIPSSGSVSTASGGSATITPFTALSAGSDSKIKGNGQSFRDEEQHVKGKGKRRFTSKLRLPKMFSAKSKDSSSSSISISPTTPTYASTLSSSSSSSAASLGINSRATVSTPAATRTPTGRGKKSSTPELGRLLTSRLLRVSPQSRPVEGEAHESKSVSDPGISTGRQRIRRFGTGRAVNSPDGFTLMMTPLNPGVQLSNLAASSAGPSRSAMPAEEAPRTPSRMTPSSLLFGPEPTRNNSGDINPNLMRGLVASKTIEAPRRPVPQRSASFSATKDVRPTVGVRTLSMSYAEPSSAPRRPVRRPMGNGTAAAH